MTKVLKILAQNRKARHEYFIEATFETGICLQGSEVKALRAGHGSIGEAYAGEEQGEIFLYNAFIPEYKQASYMNHEPRRTRKLLLHRREIRKLIGQIQRRGKTLILLSLYLNARGKVKAELGLAQGKKNVDKRQALKDKDWKLDKARLLKTQVR